MPRFRFPTGAQPFYVEFACSPQVSSGCCGFPHHQNMYIRSISSPYPWPRYWLRIWSWSPGAVLWQPTAPQGWVKCRDHISLYTVTNKVPLPLPMFTPPHPIPSNRSLRLAPPTWACNSKGAEETQQYSHGGLSEMNSLKLFFSPSHVAEETKLSLIPSLVGVSVRPNPFLFLLAPSYKYLSLHMFPFTCLPTQS